MSRRKTCATCNSTGWRKLSDTSITKCQDCCTHAEGWWLLKDHYGSDNGKWCCNAGCGKVEDKRPKNTDYRGNPVENTTLLEL